MKKRLLFVDDEPEILDLLQDIFHRSQCEILAAGSGSMALKMVRESLVDLILCDLKLPDISGIEVLQQAKQERPGIKAILTTGYFDPSQNGGEGYEKVVDKFIPKPWDILALKKEIQDLLNND